MRSKQQQKHINRLIAAEIMQQNFNMQILDYKQYNLINNYI